MTTSQSRACNRNARALAKKHPTFAPQFVAARRVLDSATIDGDELRFPRGVRCGPSGCNCNNPACLHRIAWRVFRGE